MSQAEILEKVRDLVVKQLSVDQGQVTEEASFVEDLGADSLDTVELIMQLEENFDIEIQEDEAETIRTVQDAVQFIATKKSEG